LIQESFRQRIHTIIFEADTPAGKAFDVGLLVTIIVSVILVMLESVREINAVYGRFFDISEWIITIFFTIEYLLRIYSVRKPQKYIFSFYGIVDLLAILPAFLELLVVGSQYLVIVRAIRLLRVFRIMKLAEFTAGGLVLGKALRASRPKIIVFLMTVGTIVIILGTVMYMIEGGQEEAGFTSIPRSIYWAIVTVTTVGYGDIAPVTPLGQFISAILMIIGYGIIAVPTGIVTTELASIQNETAKKLNTIACPDCSREGHESDARFCKYCGADLTENL
jgi:voltage-gated potassium channel